MKRVIAVAAIVIGIAAFCKISCAEDKLGYADMQTIFDGYSKAKDSAKVFEKEVKAEREKIEKLQNEIKGLQETFEKTKDLCKPEEKAAKEKVIQEKIMEFSLLLKETNQVLDEKRRVLEDARIDEIKKAIEKYAKKRGFSAILDSRVVLFGSAGSDVTKEIVKEINK